MDDHSSRLGDHGRYPAQTDMTKLSQILTAAILMVGLLVSVGCLQDSLDRDYRLDELEILSEGVVENGIRLTYRVPAETLYHSPGALMTRKGDQIHLTFPRVHIDAYSEVIDLKPILNDDGSRTITVPNANTENQSVEIILNDKKSLGPWTFENAG